MEAQPPIHTMLLTAGGERSPNHGEGSWQDQYRHHASYLVTELGHGHRIVSCSNAPTTLSASPTKTQFLGNFSEKVPTSSFASGQSSRHLPPYRRVIQLAAFRSSGPAHLQATTSLFTPTQGSLPTSTNPYLTRSPPPWATRVTL